MNDSSSNLLPLLFSIYFKLYYVDDEEKEFNFSIVRANILKSSGANNFLILLFHNFYTYHRKVLLSQRALEAVAAASVEVHT